MRKLFKDSLTSAVYYGGGMWRHKKSGTRILAYHRVNDEAKNYLTVPVENFRHQMRLLADAGYRTADLDEILAPRNTEDDAKKIVLTFDDGYRDNYEHVFRVLREFGFTATFFCITGEIGKKDFLTKDQLREMFATGMRIGSHTVTHPELTSLSREAKWEEIAASKTMLENMLRAPVDYFCYPRGLYDRECLDLVEQAGYRGACSNRPGANVSREDFYAGSIERYLLKRTEIAGGDTLTDLRKKLAGAFDALHRGLHWVRRRP